MGDSDGDVTVYYLKNVHGMEIDQVLSRRFIL